MDKIDSVGESFSNKSLRKKTRKKKSPAVGAFSSLLHSAAAEEEETADSVTGERSAAVGPLQELLDDVTALGEALLKTPTLNNVRRYREGIKYFLKYLVAHVLEIEERTSGANILKRKKYMLIQIVDQKLDALAREFLSRQKQPIDVAGRIDEINGLLVDLLR
jgi:uncharacterized protein YaaR (DUF327 family)